MFEAILSLIQQNLELLSLIGIAFGGALDLDGTGDQIQMPNISSYGSTGCFECWVKVDATGGNRKFMAMVGPGGEFDNVVLGVPSAGSNIAGSYRVNSSTIADMAGGTLDTDWHHIAITWATDDFELYLDGVSVDTDSAGTTDTLVFNTMFIGHDDGGGSNHAGLIDECRVWSTRRSTEQINANMWRRVAGNESGLERYYRLDDQDSGVTAISFVQGVTAGTITGNPTNSPDSAPITYGVPGVMVWDTAPVAAAAAAGFMTLRSKYWGA